jgi:hypothetical protein
MSLPPKDESGGGSGEPPINQRRRRSDMAKERYERNAIANLIRQAEYKQSLGMELTDSERFVIENKAFLLRKAKQD